MTLRLASILALAGLVAACGPTPPSENHNQNTNNNNTGSCSNGATQCLLNQVQTCQGGQWVVTMTCTAPNPTCNAGACVACQPNLNYCVGDSVYACTPQGTQGALVTTCGANEDCVSGICTSPCQVAEATKSYIGCEYWPTPTANSQLADAFLDNFGVVVHNDNDEPALVAIERGGSQVAQQDIPAHGIHTFTLPIDTGLKLTYDAEESLIATTGAYRLSSSMPVTVYQFNPLDYALDVDGSLCPTDVYYDLYPPCHSYSNDASLLLPTHVLSMNYIVMARQSFGVDNSFIPGFLAVVATEANTSVTIEYTANTAGGGVAAATPGSSQTYTLNRGEVLQVMSARPTSCSGGTQVTIDGRTYCDLGASYDLTGTRVSASARVAVFGGHNCSFVPYTNWACDHLEEQMLPLETWGKEFIVGRTEPQSLTGTDEPNVVRVVSGADANVITFNPPQALGASITLNQGEWREFEATQHFHVVADGAVMIGQFLVGQNLYAPDTYDYHGDPAYSLMVPFEQYRASYAFLAPSTMEINYVNIVKRVNEGAPAVYLDGAPVSESAFSAPVGSTHYGVASIEIPGGSHSIESTEAFGITVYGFAAYTSYSYPGGLDLKWINPVE